MLNFSKIVFASMIVLIMSSFSFGGWERFRDNSCPCDNGSCQQPVIKIEKEVKKTTEIKKELTKEIKKVTKTDKIKIDKTDQIKIERKTEVKVEKTYKFPRLRAIFGR